MSVHTSTEVVELEEQQLAAWRGMLRVHSALVKALDAELESEHRLPLSSYEVLIYLRVAPGKRLRMAELADRTLLSRSGMTRLVDRLERDGLLRRDTCSSDARGCFAVLTPRGEEVLVGARASHLQGIRTRFLAHLDDEDVRVLGKAFNKVLAGNADLSPGDLEKT